MTSTLRDTMSPTPAGQPRLRPVQATFDDLGTPLSDVTFVVVDLETTGGSAHECAITEIGAVKVRGGVVLGEFQTLVNPGEPIPAVIAVLTGITDAMVAGAPRIGAVLPSFFDFAAGAVLVAHNAPFDVGFLRAAATRLDIPWPAPQVVDTVRLARQLVGRDEAPNHRLSSLAALFGAQQTPDHRALHDARATVDVLHALIGRVGNVGVRTLEELSSYTSRVTDAQRRKRHLAHGLPSAPGVYLFKDDSGRVLYVGTSRDIRRRVSTYFTASEQRSRMAQMVMLATEVTPIVCATALEAAVRELRLIAEHEPRFNRRSRRPSRRPWIKVTREAFPRLSIVRQVRDDGARYVGPFASMQAAQEAVDAIHEVLPLRQCTTRLSPKTPSSACMLADLQRCLAPCRLESDIADTYALAVARADATLAGASRELFDLLGRRMSALSDDGRYEEAATARDRLGVLGLGCDRAQRSGALAQVPHLVAAKRSPTGGWEVLCVRYGRLAAATRSPPGLDPMPSIRACIATAEVVAPAPAPASAALPEETDMLVRWLEGPGVRLVELDGTWSCPINGAGPTAEMARAIRRDAGGSVSGGTREAGWWRSRVAG